MISANSKRLLTPIIQNCMRQRGTATSRSVVPGPSQVHVPKYEKYALGIGMAVAFLFTPGWVLYHIRDYKQPK